MSRRGPVAGLTGVVVLALSLTVGASGGAEPLPERLSSPAAMAITSPRAVPSVQRPAEEILAELHERYESLEAVSAEFVQRKRVSVLADVVELEGTFTFQPPRLFRAEVRGYENLDAYADGERLWVVDRDLEDVQVYSFEADGGVPAPLHSLLPLSFLAPAELGNRYRVRSVPPQRARYRLCLEPRAESRTSRIMIEIDGHFRTRWMRVEYANGDWTETRFEGWKRLGTISRHWFGYRGPESPVHPPR